MYNSPVNTNGIHGASSQQTLSFGKGDLWIISKLGADAKRGYMSAS